MHHKYIINSAINVHIEILEFPPKYACFNVIMKTISQITHTENDVIIFNTGINHSNCCCN